MQGEKGRSKTSVPNSHPIAGTTIGCYEVHIKEMKLNAKSAPRPPESNAIDGSSVIWIIGPLVLPNGIVGKDSAEKRFLYYTSQGLDIQDANGTSLGERNAIASQRTQNCTLPISAIVVHGIHVDETDERFLKHWEERISAEISSQIMTLLYVQWFRRIWVRCVPAIFDTDTDPPFRSSRKLQPNGLCYSCTEHTRSLEVYFVKACKP